MSGKTFAGLLLMLLVHGAIVLGGVYLMLVSFGDSLERVLDDQVERVEREFDRDLSTIRRDVRRELRRELDARLPLAP